MRDNLCIYHRKIIDYSTQISIVYLCVSRCHRCYQYEYIIANPNSYKSFEECQNIIEVI
jgi:hypothetical protein